MTKERNFRFEKTWWWVNDDRILISGWTISSTLIIAHKENKAFLGVYLAMKPLEKNAHCCESTCSFFWWCTFFATSDKSFRYQTKQKTNRQFKYNLLNLFKGNKNNLNHPFWENNSVSFFSSQMHQGSSWLLAVAGVFFICCICHIWYTFLLYVLI